jgi:hypothetical protein
MKFSNRTLSILKNFSTVNPSIMFRCGNTLNTISPQKTIMAKASIDDTIEADFGVFDLSRFLSVLSLFNEPQLILNDSFVKITDGKQSVNYIFADPENMVLPPNKEMKTLDPYFEFDLTIEQHQSLMKAASVLQLPEISVTGLNGSVYYRAIDIKNPSNNSFELNVGSTDKSFNIVFKSDNIKIMNDNYRVSLSRGIGHFKSNSLEYWIATEASSKFGD